MNHHISLSDVVGANGKDVSHIVCKFCPGVEKLFMTNGRTVGVRRDLNGVFLLETILQSAGSGDNEAVVTLELTCSDVRIQCLFCISIYTYKMFN